MKTMKGIGKFLIVFAVIFFIGLGLVHVRDKSKIDVDFWKSKSDSLFSSLHHQDSVINVLSKSQDSLLKVKSDSILKIKEVYVSEVNYINSLSLDDQVRLLSNNLSQDTLN